MIRRSPLRFGQSNMESGSGGIRQHGGGVHLNLVLDRTGDNMIPAIKAAKPSAATSAGSTFFSLAGRGVPHVSPFDSAEWTVAGADERPVAEFFYGQDDPDDGHGSTAEIILRLHSLQVSFFGSNRGLLILRSQVER